MVSLPAALNTTLINQTGTAHAAVSSPWYITASPVIIPIAIIIAAVVVSLSIINYLKTRPVKRKVKTVAKILQEEQLEDTKAGGYKPKNATLVLNSKDVYRILWYDPAFIVPEVKVPVTEIGRLEKDKFGNRKRKEPQTKKFAPLKCWYLRVKPMDTLLYRLIPRLAPQQFFKIPASKLQPTFNAKGELEYATATKTIFFDVIGGTFVDREFSAQLRANNFDRAYWKAEDLSNMANFADLSLEKTRVASPVHAGRIDAIQESGSAQEGIEKSKRPGSDYG